MDDDDGAAAAPDVPRRRHRRGEFDARALGARRREHFGLSEHRPGDTIYRAGTGPSLTWQAAGTLPESLLDLGVVFTRNTMILTGGAHRSYPQGSTTCPWKDASIRSAVYLATLDTQGGLGPWRAGPELPAPRADHTAVLYGD